METNYQVLDHGYLKLIEHWGSDERIIESARMSTDKGFLGWDKFEVCKSCSGSGENDTNPCRKCEGKGCINVGDVKLLKYLYDNKHETPFEFCGVVIEVQAPIFVFREWHRHRTQSYNEMSARYTPLPDLNYIPTVERLMINSKTNKQAGTIKDAIELTEDNAEIYRKHLQHQYSTDQTFYEYALSIGVPKELARIHLPVGRYSKMRASTNLRNWLAFMTLRSAEVAQWEIRQYSQILEKVVQDLFPRTYELWCK